jgi:sulfate/thiosulfate transport system permease protein
MQTEIRPQDEARPSTRPGRAVRVTMVAAAVTYVAALLVGPLIGIAWSALKPGFRIIPDTFSLPDVQHAFLLTAVITVITVAVTGVFGVLVALVLARDRFPGKRMLSAIVDLPLAVSPVIVGLMAVLLFGRGGWFEPFFAARGIQIIFALPSMVLVTLFICIPFVIREVAPVLEELGMEEEQAAWTLGASRLQTFFRVTLPNIRWGLLYGVALSAARAMGEIGAVLIVSGAIRGKTETATLYILLALEERQDAQANVVALTLAASSIVILIGIETFRRRQMREVP